MNDKTLGIACEKCGKDMGVIRTTQSPGFIQRRRACECGHRITTVERPVSEPVPTPNSTFSGLEQVSIGDLLAAIEKLANSPHQSEKPWV